MYALQRNALISLIYYLKIMSMHTIFSLISLLIDEIILICPKRCKCESLLPNC